MKKDEMIRASFDFLREKANKGEGITATELAERTGWTQLNARTNISKRIRPFLEEDRKHSGHFKVKANILDIDYTNYASLFKQADVLVRNYDERHHPDVVVYELFMPLTCEDKLKRALDKLFYKDSILQKLRALETKQIRNIFPPKPNETDNEYYGRVCSLAGNRFGGYSISHVNGRFRDFNLGLLTKTEAAETEDAKDKDYLMDETTANVRFIFPIDATEELVEYQEDGLPLQMQMEFPDMRESVNDEHKQIQWLFRNLFMTTILNTIGQEQIWVLESGKRSQLTRFVVSEKEQ